MPSPIAVQLYSVRDALAHDYVGVIRRIADMGYVGVEMAGLYLNDSPRETAALLADHGLRVSSAHMPPPLGDQQVPLLEAAAALGAAQYVVPYFPPEQFATAADVDRICDLLNQTDDVVRANGLTLSYHNHWWEFQPLGGTGEAVFRYMLRKLNPTIHFEIDAYWVKTGGMDPVAVLRELGDRVTLLHVKDGPANTDDPMLAVGEGVMDYTAVIPAAASTEWLIVELDRCATDMLEAVHKSYTYLTSRGLANGR